MDSLAVREAFEQIAKAATTAENIGVVADDLAAHIAAPDPHPQYTTAVELSAAVTAAIAALIGTAPATLDTLGELADALADDAAFSATVMAAIGAKQIAIQFKDEGINVGALGAITEVDFVGAGVTASVAGTVLTITIAGGGGGGGSGDAIAQTYTQAAHGLAVGTLVSRVSGSFVAADRDDATKPVFGVVSVVPTANSLTIVTAGKVTLTTLEWAAVMDDGVAPNDAEHLWWSSTAGKFSKTPATTGLKQYVGQMTSTTTLEVAKGDVFDLSAATSGGGPTLLASYILGAPGTTLTIPTGSFSLSARKRLRVVIKGKNNTASHAGFIQCYLNADTTPGNYRSQLGALQGSSPSTSRQVSPDVAYLYASVCFNTEIILELDLDNKCRAKFHTSGYDPANSTVHYGSLYYNIAADITGLIVVAPANLTATSFVEVWSH